MNDSLRNSGHDRITDETAAMSNTGKKQIEVKGRTEESFISVVLPVYNEVEVLERLVSGISEAFADTTYRFEIVFVNDGSTDGSAEALDALSSECGFVRVVHFSRNFGHQSAVHAGLIHASGDAIVLMDSDLQDDPTAIPKFVQRWREGFDVVYALRIKRKENWFKRILFYSFYRLLNAIATTDIPMDAGNFSLIDRRVACEVIQLPERDRFFPGLRHWVGFRQIGIPVERHARHDDQPRVSTAQLFSLAKTAIFGFSRAPLNCFYGFAMISMLVFLACSCFTMYHKIVTHLAIPGWTSITIVASAFGMLNALGICVLGEYVIRIYDQVRARPGFVVSRHANFCISASPGLLALSAARVQPERSTENLAGSMLAKPDDGSEEQLQQMVREMSRDLDDRTLNTAENSISRSR